MLTKENITVTHVATGGMAFAFTDAGTSVYVPRKVATAARVAAFQSYRACLVPNTFQPEKTPLMAVAVETGDAVADEADDEVIEPIEADAPEVATRADEPAPTEPSMLEFAAQVGERAVELVMQGGVWTTRALAEAAGGPNWQELYAKHLSSAIFYRLKVAHEAGTIARMQVMQRADQNRASFVKWAKSAEMLA